MEITVYAKPGCNLCASFKAKLRDNLHVPFAERDLEHALRVSNTWREDKTDKLKAAHVHLGEAVPLIVIDKNAYRYAEALAEIKRRLKAGEEAIMPELERDNSLDEIGPSLTEAEFITAAWELCANHVDLLMVTSSVKRTYDGAQKPAARREVLGGIEVWLHYRDPTARPMCLLELTVGGYNFREVLRNLRDRIEAAKGKGTIWSGEREHV